jgi:hypothetical protein
MMLNIAMSITPFSRSSLERASVFYVGQYSMQITASGGSEFSANQHVVDRVKTGNLPGGTCDAARPLTLALPDAAAKSEIDGLPRQPT